MCQALSQELGYIRDYIKMSNAFPVCREHLKKSAINQHLHHQYCDLDMATCLHFIGISRGNPPE